MLFHSLRTKVLRSFHNNTQQPFIYLVKGKSVVVHVVLIWEKTDKGGLSLITRTTPTKQQTCLLCSVAMWVRWNCLTSGESFIKRPVKTSVGKAVRRLALNGQRGIRSVIYKLQAVCKHTSSFFIAPLVRSGLQHQNVLLEPQILSISEECHPACTQ